MMANYQVLMSGEDPTPFFERWQGGKAAIWSYGVSHRILQIRVEREDIEGYITIWCGDVQHLCGPMKWNDSHFETERCNDEIILSDKRAGFELRAGLVGVEENPYSPYKSRKREE